MTRKTKEVIVKAPIKEAEKEAKKQPEERPQNALAVFVYGGVSLMVLFWAVKHGEPLVMIGSVVAMLYFLSRYAP